MFRTPIGFHDAYVAAPSRKAALEIWGAGTDLFQAGISEEVKDLASGPAKEALASPGEVVRARRTGADIVPMPRRPARRGKTEKESSPRPKSRVTKEEAKPQARPKPRPSRAPLDRAENALAELGGKQRAERAELEREEAELADRRRTMEKKQRAALEKAEARRDEAERQYRRAMKEWAG